MTRRDVWRIESRTVTQRWPVLRYYHEPDRAADALTRLREHGGWLYLRLVEIGPDGERIRFEHHR